MFNVFDIAASCICLIVMSVFLPHVIKKLFEDDYDNRHSDLYQKLEKVKILHNELQNELEYICYTIELLKKQINNEMKSFSLQQKILLSQHELNKQNIQHKYRKELIIQGIENSIDKIGIDLRNHFMIISQKII